MSVCRLKRAHEEESSQATCHATHASPQEQPSPTSEHNLDDEETLHAWCSRVGSARLDDNPVFLDSAATAHMIHGDSNLSRYVTRETRCDIVTHGSCSKTRAERKGRLDFTVTNTKGRRRGVYHLEVPVAPKLGANLLSLGALEEKGARSGSSRSPPVPRCRELEYPLSLHVNRMYPLKIIPVQGEQAYRTSSEQGDI